jgi:hypothetical protein
MADPTNYVIGLLVAILIVYEIMVNAFAILLPAATAITVVGINFAFIITIAVIIGFLYAMKHIVTNKSWK